MPTTLSFCTSETEQIAWAVAHLKKGGRIHDIGLWLGGVDRPLRLVAKVKQVLRTEGRVTAKAIEAVQDADGEPQQVLVWRLADMKGQANTPP